MIPLRRAALCMLAMLLALPGATDAIPPPHTPVFWTAPQQPVAGEPAQLLFLRNIVNSTENTLLRVEQEPGRVVLVYRSVCTGWCDTDEPHVFTATLPPLTAGSYVVAMAYENANGLADHHQELGSIEVVTGPAPQPMSPASGYWAPVQEPGSGLFLEERSGLLAVALYSYLNDGDGFWWLGSAPLRDAHVLLPLQSFVDGSCLGCPSEGPPAAHTDGALRLRFESARRALADINGVEDIALVSVPYGAAYVDTALEDTVDATWGPLPLPDLRGNWIFAVEEAEARKQPLNLHFDSLETTDDAVKFSQGEEYAQLTCRSADSLRRAGCEYLWTGLVFGTPPPDLFPAGPIWFALGDVEEDRMRGTVTIGDQEYHVRAFRLPAASTVAAAAAGTPE